MYLAAMLLLLRTESECMFMMDTIKFNKANTKVVAHRGLSGLEPENTVAAFVAAGNRSYYGAECDVHVTKDGKFVVIHDETTKRVASKNVDVEKSKLKKIRKVLLDDICGLERKELGAEVHYCNRCDLYVPEMHEYINICKKYGKKCVLEVKNRMKTEDIKRMVDEISSLEYLDSVIFISFSLENVIDLRKLLPNQQVQFLIGKYDEEVLKILNDNNVDLDIQYKALTKEIIDEVHANGHIVNCWTVDDKEAAEQLADWGVDQITTNILE